MSGAALPLILGGGLLGANVAKNKNQNLLQGALQGALLGGLGSAGAGLLSKTPATIPVVEASVGGDAALKAKLASDAAAAKVAAAKTAATKTSTTVGTDSIFSAADLGLNVNPATGASFSIPTDTFGAFQAKNAANKVALDSVVGNIANPITEKIALSPGAKILSTIKNKPIETMLLTSTLGGVMGGGQGGSQVVSSGPITQPGGFGDVPTVEESIAMDRGPKFVSKGLFDESKRSMEEEEMALMYQNLSEAGLV